MSANMVVVGVFADQTLAQQALTELHEAGFPDQNIGFIVRDAGAVTEALPQQEIPVAETTGREEHPGTATGIVAGGVVGGVVGAAVSLLIPGVGPALAGGIIASILGGAVVGAAAGGLIGTLIHIGIPEEEARYYEREFQSGRTIVIVDAGDRPMEAFHILEHNHAYNARSAPQDLVDPEATVELKPLQNE